MQRYSLSHLAPETLLPALHEKVALGRRGTAEVIALIGEIEKRRLYAPAGYPSMYEYCVRKLGLSEDEASRRIYSARLARRFPIIFELVADGRLHLTGVRLLRDHLTPANANELLSASIGKTRKEIEQLIADRFPRPGVPTLIMALPPAGSGNQTQPIASAGSCGDLPAPARVNGESPALLAPAAAAPPIEASSAPRPRVTALGAERYALQVELRKSTHDKLRRLQELLGSRVAGGDLDAMLEHAFDMAIAQLEKKKFAATDKPRVGKPSSDPRHIPARVKRAVRERDKNQCAFIGDNGHRCVARRGLEFDHIEPVARGGESTVSNVRLLCRTHNQLEAERAFGDDLMKGKRAAATERGQHARSA